MLPVSMMYLIICLGINCFCMLFLKNLSERETVNSLKACMIFSDIYFYFYSFHSVKTRIEDSTA